MSRKTRKAPQPAPTPTRAPAPQRRGWLVTAAVVALVAVGMAAVLRVSRNRTATQPQGGTAAAPPSSTGGGAHPTSAPVPQSRPEAPVATNPGAGLSALEINQAVMVTVELDFGDRTPGIAEALREVERRYQPDDGVGRTFAILDADGEPTKDGKLHMSMHVSSEKPGIGSLVFKPTGEVLWSSRFVLGGNAAPSDLSSRSLTILLDNGSGKTQMIDGSNDPASILDAGLRGLPIRVRDAWPDGAEREVTFIYSACGCPVKVTCRRQGQRTVRTTDLPVIFPDDPAAVGVISRLMGW